MSKFKVKLIIGIVDEFFSTVSGLNCDMCTIPTEG